MKRKGIMWITGLLTLCLCAEVLTGCGGQTSTESTTAAENAAEQTGDTDEENTTAESGETKGEETEAQAEGETSALTEEFYPGPVYKINWLDVEFPFERITGYMTNGEVVYICGENRTEELAGWREQVISCDPDGTNQKVIFNIPTKEDQADSDIYRTFKVMNVDAEGNLLMGYKEYLRANWSAYYLEKMNRDGEVLWTVAFPMNVHEVNSTVIIGEQLICAVSTLREGGVYDKRLVLVYDSEGNLLEQYDTGSKMPMSVMTYGGKLYLTERGGMPDSIYSGYREFQLETGEPGEEFADGLQWYGELIGSGCGYELLVQDHEGIWGYHLKGVSCVKVLDFELSGLDSQMDAIIRPYGEDEFLLIVKNLKTSSWAESSMAILTKVTWEELKDK